MRHPGLILDGYQPFQRILRPLAVEVAPCFSLIDTQSGPFNSTWLFDSPKNEAIVEGKHFDAPACRNTSSTCWRPHTFPRLAEHVIVDEWTYFFAMRCEEADMPRRTEWISDRIGKFTAEFFDQLEQFADLFLCHVDGWWELYTHHAEWQTKFRDGFPECYERSWRKAGDPPSKV